LSRAKEAFDLGIGDAEVLMARLNDKDAKLTQEQGEVHKRATLLLACAAWETYVEERVSESLEAKINVAGSSDFTEFVKKRLEEELKSFNNPNAEKTRKLFRDFLAVKDVTHFWRLSGYTPDQARQRLDTLFKKRGHAAHHTRPAKQGTLSPHLITKPELEKGLNFLKMLVEATERGIGD
jgi:hypothetical protein